MQSDEPRIAASNFSSCVREFQIAVTMHLSLDRRPQELPTFKALLLLWPTWLSYAPFHRNLAWPNHHHLMRYATKATSRFVSSLRSRIE
jgi:hypothetical protein